jgi:endonuclease-8
VPEGDTLFRTAAGLRPFLVGRRVDAASARQPGPQAARLVGATVTGVEARGKNVLIRFDNGLELRTHLGMHGSWHRYRPGERWRRPADRARLVLEVAGSVAVCFDAPTVQLFEQRAEAAHPALSRLGPDLIDDAFDRDEAIRRLRDPARAATSIAEALLDQRALAGIGNVYKSEVLFIERASPFVLVSAMGDEALGRLVDTAARLLRANALRRGGGAERVTTDGHRSADGPLWVYGRAGRPCRRCGARVRTATQGIELPRVTYWCPHCQPAPEDASTRRA